MKYGQWVLIGRPSGPGEVDEDSGDWTPAALTTLYEGFADVQDKGVTIERDASGYPTRSADGTLFLPETVPVGGFRVGDTVRILWNPEVTGTPVDWDALPDGADAEDAQVAQVTRLDQSMFIERV